MERHGHLRLDPVVRSGLLDVSAATIDRLLRPVREASCRTRRRRWGLGSAIRPSLPVRTFDDWGEPSPGYCEADLVEHCGGEHEGSFAHTLTLTDIHSGWTECAAAGGPRTDARGRGHQPDSASAAVCLARAGHR